MIREPSLRFAHTPGTIIRGSFLCYARFYLRCACGSPCTARRMKPSDLGAVTERVVWSLPQIPNRGVAPAL